MSKNVISCWEWCRLDKPRRERQKAKNRLASQKRFAACYTNSGNGPVRAAKRPKPKNELCEVCESKPLVVYHHWLIKDKKIYGIWICRSCHPICDRTDKHPARRMPEKYLTLKEQINTVY